MRVLLGEKEFDDLVGGKTVKQNGVEIALSDIGYHRMLEIIKPKLEDLYNK